MDRPARVWKRILAFLVDLYIGVMVFSAFFIIVEHELPTTIAAAASAMLSPAAIAALIYACIFLMLYHTFAEYIVGQTVGMVLFNLSIKSVTKKPLTFWQAVTRNLFLLPVFPLTLLWIIEPLYYVFQGERLLEYWTHTTTVE